MSPFKQNELLEEALTLNYFQYEGLAKQRLALVARSIEEPNVYIPKFSYSRKQKGRK